MNKQCLPIYTSICTGMSSRKEALFCLIDILLPSVVQPCACSHLDSLHTSISTAYWEVPRLCLIDPRCMTVLVLTGYVAARYVFKPRIPRTVRVCRSQFRPFQCETCKQVERHSAAPQAGADWHRASAQLRPGSAQLQPATAII